MLVPTKFDTVAAMMTRKLSPSMRPWSRASRRSTSKVETAAAGSEPSPAVSGRWLRMTRPTGTMATPSRKGMRQPHSCIEWSLSVLARIKPTEPANSEAMPWLAICHEAMKPRCAGGAASSR